MKIHLKANGNKLNIPKNNPLLSLSLSLSKTDYKPLKLKNKHIKERKFTVKTMSKKIKT
jgi:hypothetical protein